MSGPEPASEVEAAKMANGSGPLSEDMGAEAVAEKDSEEKNNGDEKKDGDENKVGDQNKDGEDKKDMEGKKETEENGMKKVEVEEEGKDEKKTEDVNTGEAEDVKMVDAEDVKTVESKDVKMVDAEDSGDEEDGVKEVGEEEGGADSNLKQSIDVKEDNGNMEKKVDDNKVEGLKKKRARSQKVSDKGEAKEKKERGTKSKELLSTPTPSFIDRPVRERKTVERLVEVIEKEPDKEFLVEKGRGIPLKDIPNVAYKLGRKKPADLKLLHQTLFGRKGKAVNFKNHILQFSGFVWHESDEKQRAKMKEKLDKYVKDTLLDLCDLFDIPVSKTAMRKEDLVAKLLDFMVAPHATTDVILADKQQSMKSRKRKRVTKGSASKSVAETPTKQSRKKKREDSSNSKGKNVQENEEEDEEDNGNGISDEDEAFKQSECGAKESESEEAADEDGDDNEDSGKGKEDKKRSSKRRGSVGKEKSKVETSSRKSSFPTSTKTPTKISSSKRLKAEDDKDVGAKVFSRKKRNVDVAREKPTLKSDKKERATGKRAARGKGKSMEGEHPSEEELRKTICEILKEVDFNTATFTDILKQLATHYKKDLTPRKPAIKELIQEELTKLADEAEEDEDDEDEDAEKEENPEPSGKEVKT
ncbi:protein DEK-like [Phoenix dactylifera]|uniref:Protein DEK-like n=1 Tax=Phoenix dactylifera TaxID=42345 RepID=A0A8B7D2F1_PHODC|nr:protein DEK-like [Phoenix dactylifera]XP_008811639.1 protein DEK-like [Phoenix dactylifera]